MNTKKKKSTSLLLLLLRLLGHTTKMTGTGVIIITSRRKGEITRAYFFFLVLRGAARSEARILYVPQVLRTDPKRSIVPMNTTRGLFFFFFNAPCD
jgi:hypothetical protein